MAIWAIVEDLVFRSKIDAAARSLGLSVRVTADAAPPPDAPPGRWDVVLIGLDRSRGDPLALVTAARRQAPSARIIGYGAHVHADLLNAAVRAGCTTVLSRSAFVQRLAELLLRQ